jgi:microcystin degradation protein MlrC
MIANCDVMLSFKTYPHIDMYETGEHVARLVLAMLRKELQPYMTYRQLPILSHTLRSNTNEGAMQQVVKQALAIENEKGILGTSILAGFSLADFYDAGMSVIIISDERHPNSKIIAEKYAEKLAQQIMDLADDFIYTSAPSQTSLDDAIHLQQKSGSGPVLLLDHSDNVMSGGTCDTTDILELALATGLNNLAAGPIADPITVNQLLKIGLEKKCTIALGNRSGWTYQGKPKKPLILEGVVKKIHSGDILVSGPIFTGSILRMGPSVLFETQQAQIVISSERVEPYDLGVMLELGIEIENKSFVLLKSRMYCRPVFTPLCKGLIECDSDQGGPTSSNYARFDFQKVRRPIFPLDALPG